MKYHLYVNWIRMIDAFQSMALLQGHKALTSFLLSFSSLSSISTTHFGFLDHHRTSSLCFSDNSSILLFIKMPKDRRDRSVSIDRSWTSPYICNTSHSRRSLTKNPLETESVKEWEEARCPVCMEHPHNAILLLCSSHEKGCRPFMCDTSYRHSNCFDQFQKASSEMQQLMDQQEGTPVTPAQTAPSGTLEGGSTPALKLVCPLCRGEVNGWIVVEAARVFMNSKSRSCASETCDFTGTYTDLRKHARLVHPLVRPSEADPDRQRDWRRLERQRDIGDLLSSLQSSIGDERSEDNTTSALSFDEGGWMTSPRDH
ncbi:hypothetical protein QVD17_00449 [Tagetes erecta]|uniref:Uncharacterized protein n=1 Tax=Tagetes erecta TaxID=13708 RepID=A0AAD8P0M1_TARER|nr:hypothetical protein QVD17_00449 [Tagetes erecta]